MWGFTRSKSPWPKTVVLGVKPPNDPMDGVGEDGRGAWQGVSDGHAGSVMGDP